MNAIAIVPAQFHTNAVALVADGRINVAAIVRHCLAPYAAADEFEDVIETVRLNSTPARKSKNERKSAAIAIRKAVAGHTKAVRKAQHELRIALLPPDEICIRQILGIMFGMFPTPPTNSSESFADTLVFEMVDARYSLPAIMAAAREAWQTMPAPPAISDLLALARKHEDRLDAVFRQLGSVLTAIDWADDLLEPDKPVEWDESDPDFIPF
jgi:hypothetical protein